MRSRKLEMRNKKVGIGNGKWGFYFLLLTSYFLLLTLFLPEDVMAQREDITRMRKYSLWGDIVLQYEDEQRGGSNSANKFTQNYRLNLRSYVISPRFMYYTINTGFNMQSGTMVGSTKTSKNYGITTVFFPRRPFNFSLRASKADSVDYKNLNYGLSVSYSRKVRRVPTVKPAAPPEGEENTNLNENINANLNAGSNLNLNTNTDEEGDYVNENITPKPKPKPQVKATSNGGFFYDILPTSYLLDVDRNDTKYKDGSESRWDGASLRLLGSYMRTGYYLNFDYDAWLSDSAEHKGFGSELRTDTALKWSFFQRFENYIYFRKNDITSYNISPSLTGSTKKWSYGIYANYSATINSESARQYNICTYISNKTPYTYKGVNLSYSMGFGFNRSGNKNDFFANGRVDAQKRLSLNTNVHSSLSVRGGTVGSSFDFQTGINYTFRPRKGYALDIELDPKKDIIKTRTFKPQVSGWDYSIGTGYIFGISKTTGEGGVEVGAAQRTNKTLVSHRADLNIDVYLRLLTISSDAYFYYTDAGKRLEWNNSIYATVMRKIGVTIGTGLTVDMPEDGTKTTDYNIYNLITYRLSRAVLLRLDSRYTKVMPADTTTLEVTPSLTWAWRKVFVELEVRLKTEKTLNGAETKERRIMMRVTRPFNIL